MGMTGEIKNIRLKKPIQGEIYITRMIIEDRCWHLEIDQLGKTLPNQKQPVLSTSRRRHRAGRLSTLPYAACYLEDWY